MTSEVQMTAIQAGRRVRFLFDPDCPWAWRASLWVREVARARPLAIEWGLLSLEYVNRDRKDNPQALHQRKTGHALRLLARARQIAGNEGIDALYLAIGEARHDEQQALDDENMLAQAVARAGLPAALVHSTSADRAFDAELEAGYAQACAGGAFGVPTLYIDGSEVPYYGPLIAAVPDGDEAVELWDHVVGLTRLRFFYELKRKRL